MANKLYTHAVHAVKNSQLSTQLYDSIIISNDIRNNNTLFGIIYKK